MTEKDLTCFSCAHVITTSETGKPVACRKDRDVSWGAPETCDDFCYEPGADEADWMEVMG